MLLAHLFLCLAGVDAAEVGSVRGRRWQQQGVLLAKHLLLPMQELVSLDNLGIELWQHRLGCFCRPQMCFVLQGESGKPLRNAAVTAWAMMLQLLQLGRQTEPSSDSRMRVASATPYSGAPQASRELLGMLYRCDHSSA